MQKEFVCVQPKNIPMRILFSELTSSVVSEVSALGKIGIIKMKRRKCMLAAFRKLCLEFGFINYTNKKQREVCRELDFVARFTLYVSLFLLFLPEEHSKRCAVNSFHEVKLQTETPSFDGSPSIRVCKGKSACPSDFDSTMFKKNSQQKHCGDEKLALPWDCVFRKSGNFLCGHRWKLRHQPGMMPQKPFWSRPQTDWIQSKDRCKNEWEKQTLRIPCESNPEYHFHQAFL